MKTSLGGRWSARRIAACVSSVLVSCVISLSARKAFAQWAADPLLLAGDAAHWAWLRSTCPDGKDGAWVFFEWGPAGTGSLENWAAHIDPLGHINLGPRRMAVEGISSTLSAIADGHGGCYLGFVLPAPGDSAMNVLHMDPAGDVDWPAPVRVGPAASHGPTAAMALTSDGRLLLAWAGPSGGTAQRLNTSGYPEWGPNGVSFTTDPSFAVSIDNRERTSLVPDPAGGAFIGWKSSSGFALVQRIDASGTARWSMAGVSAYPSSPDWGPLLIANDAEGVWSFDSGQNGFVARTLDSTGTPLVGSPFSARIDAFTHPRGGTARRDPSGSIDAVWLDEAGLHRQRIRPDGSMRWSPGGISIWPDPAIGPTLPIISGDDQRLVALLAGGATLVGSTIHVTELGQSQDSLGAARWPGTHRTVLDLACNDAQFAYCMNALRLVPSREHSSLVVFGTTATTAPYRPSLYAQRIDGDGRFGLTEPVVLSVSDVAGDAGGNLRVRWRPSDLERDSLVTGLVYDVERAPAEPGPWSAVSTGLPGGSSLDSLDIASFADSSASCDCRTWVRVRVRADGGLVHLSTPRAGASIPDALLAADPLGAAAIRLEPIQPSPASGRVTIRWSIPFSARAMISLYDAGGRRVSAIESGALVAGPGSRTIELRDSHGRALEPGIYFVRLELQGRRLVRRLVVRN